MTQPTIVDVQALAWLGRVVQTIRPQWDLAGIRSALERAAADHRYADIALVAVSSARDPSAATPAVIEVRCRNGWTSTTNDEVTPPTPTSTNFLQGRCKCGLWVVRGENHTCARIGDPRAGAAKARAELRKLIASHVEEVDA